MSAFTQEDRSLLADSINRFVADAYGPERRAAILTSDEGFGRAEWATYAELGWLGIAIAEAHGGSGGGLAELAVLMRAAGHGLLMEPLLPTLVQAAGALAGGGSAAQQAEWLPAIAEGRAILAFAQDNAAQDEAPVIAEATGDGYRLSGRRGFVLYGAAADRIIVKAERAGQPALFLLSPTAPGVTLAHARSIDDRPVSDLTLDRVQVAEADRLPGGDAALLERLNQMAALAVCAEAVGAMQAANRLTLDYLKTRTQFGTSIGNFQVLQHRMVDMTLAAQEAAAITWAAIGAASIGAAETLVLTAAAKARSAAAARLIGEQSIQLHGGIGMTEEYVIGHYYRRLMLLETLFGGAGWHLDRLGGWTAAGIDGEKA
ncbi:pimeloyl-CoA dehydrogenase small subunit [Niveispirillum sp. SYP-B3756]|uniref:acyl-CoA dehydrogenase family protein n=1 Tax=Niveispirillum sp. SYP-B3756 TaxID=2662178 RepID=UPI0012918D5D|nr:acyl-CoA dehydrogenase family protein [Niveispirillum sp. SYP-B3756]MQP64951.1 pimeloyl-CoA dehydrogenase small subunit [Niveispirillum sp. SYP-B3756]